MATEALKTMKEQIMNCVQGQLGDIAKVNTHELGEAIDMIKDLAEAIYYCTITDSMETNDELKKQGSTNINYYTTPVRTTSYPSYMYYDDDRGNYSEIPSDMRRDPREGRAYMRRKMYMEGQELHRDVNSQMRELEAYLQELSTDITEMIKNATPEEKATLRQKMTNLANKIN